MSLSDSSKINISIKKLSGKAQTSNDKDLANEGLPSGVTITSETVFGDPISKSPGSTSLYTITDSSVEFIRFQASFIAGTDTSSGRHGFELKLPSDYEASSSNSLAGTYPFVNNQTVNITSGSLQLIPTSFASSYEAKAFYGGTSAKNSGTQIPVLDARDWSLDYFNGIFFQQDPPGTGDHSENPDFVEAFLYVGSFVSSKLQNVAAAEYVVTALTGSLTNEKLLTAGSGITVVTSSNAVTISSDGSQSIRAKSHTRLTASHPAGADFGTPIDFSVVSYSFNRIDVFVNGQMLASGTNQDYILNTLKTGSIQFTFDLFKDDTVTATLA